MRWFAWLMLVGFALVGAFLLWEGLRTLLITLLRRPRLRRVYGTVMTVEKTRETRSSADDSSPMRTYVKFHPVINFTNETGQIISFKSEMGESCVVEERWDGTRKEPVSRYSAGQRLEVFYDPEGELRPCIASWAGLWGPPLSLLLAGAVFWGGSALIWFAFKAKLMGR